MDWHRAETRKPLPFVPVLVRLPGENPSHTVREGFVKRDGSWYAGGFDRLPDEVTHWAEMPEFPGDQKEPAFPKEMNPSRWLECR